MDQLQHCHYRKAHPPIIILAVIVSLTSLIGYRFYNEPKLDVGRRSPQTLRAPSTAKVEDLKTTEEQRQKARTGAIPVLMLDVEANQQIYANLAHAFAQGKALREQAGKFPFLSTAVLSTATQLYVRQVEQPKWEALLQALGQPHEFEPLLPQSLKFPFDQQLSVRRSFLDASQQRAMAELKAYRQSTSSQELSILLRQIDKVRWSYLMALSTLTNSEEVAALYELSFFDLSDATWQSAQGSMRQIIDRMVAQGIHPGLPKPLIQQAIRQQVEADVPTVVQPLARKVLEKVLRPNLIRDSEQTKIRAEQAARSVEPVVVAVQQGDVIVDIGEKISQTDFVLLDHFGLSRRGINWWGLVGFGALVGGSVYLLCWIERAFHLGLRQRDHWLLFLLTLSAPLVIIVGVPSTSLPVIGLLVGSFYGSALGVTLVGLLSVILPVGMEISWSALIASTAGGIVGGLIAVRLRSREELALLGGTVGLTQGAVYLLCSTMTNSIWYIALGAAGLQGLLGVAWSVIALGLSPYLEHLFDLVTPIRLAELSNPNRPLLKRLAAETPGTFQHTLFVSTLAEAAARALGCNVELVRAGTLYHDIGKMHDPLGFIENQMGGPNKHDAIADPWKSREIIRKHVTEGLVMARKYRLPKAIQAFIPEHQGTMLIAYFYHQAQQQAQQTGVEPLLESDFRYDGPIPQSRETGIVMLADSCEAALRSLKDACPKEALAMINRILKARWQDNQLVDSGLTREEMSRIAEVFVQVWQQSNHQRITYPKAVFSGA